MNHPHGSDYCLLCGKPLPADRRWRITKMFAPRFPVCDPATEECFRGLARRMGAHPTDAQVAEAVRNARRKR